jgi:hypothetical protein
VDYDHLKDDVDDTEKATSTLQEDAATCVLQAKHDMDLSPLHIDGEADSEAVQAMESAADAAAASAEEQAKVFKKKGAHAPAITGDKKTTVLPR